MAKIDLGRLAREAAGSASALLHPRDIFNALPAKAPGYDYLRGPQDQVLDQWFARRTQDRDLVVKLNTGGGKTLVGLLVARACLNEGAGPVAYLVPDHYLAAQVRAEADRLGIETTDEPRSFAYTSGKAVLVAVFQRLFNGQSIFGVAGTAGKPASVQVGTVIIDDAHACLVKAEEEFRLKVPAGEDAYDRVLALFADDLAAQSPAGLMDLQARRASGIQQIPYWAWADRQPEVLAALHPLSDTVPYKFAWPLLVDVLPICRAVVTSDALEVAPPCLPVSQLIGFANARRRVYLTATLADDGILVTDFDADPKAVESPIVPASAGDIGDRLILVPEQTHPGADPNDVRALVLGLAADRNVVVIVPSGPRADRWRPDAALVLDRTNLAEGVEKLRADPRLGLAVLVNRYDGVDLPGDACHVLVIDGLPEALDGVERLDQAQLSGSATLIARQVQRLEQGMGRAVRSNEDHCVVVLLGARLAERLHGAGARDAFSPATRAQLDLSEAIAEDLHGLALTDLRDIIDQCLGRDPGWVAASRSVLATLRYGPAKVSPVAIASRRAFELASGREYRAASDALQPALDAAADPAGKGYLLQQTAAYQHHVDPAGAQQTQLAANRLNRNVLRPREGIDYEKLPTPALEQGAAASSYLQQRYATANDLLLGLAAVVDDLDWGPRTEAFEQAWSDLAWHLGLAGQTPEADTGRGPDGLWALAGREFAVVEAKSRAVATHPVYKDDAEQLSNAMDWFRAEYPGMHATPVLIHPKSRFDKQAAVPTGCRVVTTEKLDGLRETIRRYATGLADQDTFRDAQRLTALLATLGLTAAVFLGRHAVAARPGA